MQTTKKEDNRMTVTPYTYIAVGHLVGGWRTHTYTHPARPHPLPGKLSTIAVNIIGHWKNQVHRSLLR